MAPIVPDPRRIKAFATADDFEKWLAAHHDDEPEIWLKVFKKSSGRASVTPAEALDIALCWGWIDATRKGLDDVAFLQRYCPRTRKSMWSQINRDNVARLIAAGRMTEHGQREIDAAKADGRWDAAYAPVSATTKETLPADLLAAINASARAKKTFATLDKQNIFALAFRVGRMKTDAGRKKKIEELVAILARGEPIVARVERVAKAKGVARAKPVAKAKRGPRASSRAK